MASPDPSEDPMQSLLARLTKAAEGENVTVRDLILAAGQRSFSTLLFAVSVVMVSPLSGIPTLPTIGSLIITLVVAQWMAGRSEVWLPSWILSRSFTGKRFRRGLTWLDRPARFIDRHTHARLDGFVRMPLGYLALFLVLGIVISWPFLELLPLFTTITAIGVALIAFGLMTHDGLWVLLGYVWIGLLAGMVTRVF